MSTIFEVTAPLCEHLIDRFKRLDIDNIDRLNHRYATLFFILASVLVIVRMYVGELINCWAPAQFEDHWVEYANSLCWVSNTYYVPPSELDIMSVENRTEIAYYQWVPLVLLTQALLFYIPCALWAVLNKSLGADIKRIITLLRQEENTNPNKRGKVNQIIAQHLNRLFNVTMIYPKSGPCGRFKNQLIKSQIGCGKRCGNYLVTLYILLKLIHLANTFLQIYMLNYFLGTNYTFYGIEVLRQLASKGSYDASIHFPKVTLCDFEIRSFGRNIPYSVQCTLPVNIFNEKIFITVWFVLCLLLLVNLVSLVHWVWVIFSTNRRRFFKRLLKVAGDKYDRSRDQAKLSFFTNQYLRQDGHFIMRLIGTHLGDVAVVDLVEKLWIKSAERYKKIEKCRDV